MSFILRIEDYLLHYGTPRKSGRYKWGSGKDEKIHEGSFLDITQKMKRSGMGDTEIARGFNMTTSQYRAKRSIESNERKLERDEAVAKLHEKGVGASEIGRMTGLPESSVRSTIASMRKERSDNIFTIAETLKKEVDEKEYIQIGAGVEHLPGLRISSGKLNNAVAILKEQGYVAEKVQQPQAGSPGNFTTVRVLAKPGENYRSIKANRDKIQLPGIMTDDGGRSFKGLKPPLNIDPKRIKVVYKEDGGDKADGLIEVRPGVNDVSIGGKNYAQVRIAVGGTHYMKGMAVYKDDLPDGIDLQFNTNKSSTGNKMDALKKMQELEPGVINEKNPFGSTISRQILSDGPPDKQKPTSVMNLVNEEGDWGKWKDTLSAQVLSKQSPALAKQQLKAKQDKLKEDLDEIKSLTNPVVRKHLLEKYADGADASAVHLEAAALPRQSTHVILPVRSLKETQVYAPNYNDGDTVALIRFPHGGKFEIPELQVNNKNREAIKMMGKRPFDAIGIHPKVAEKLSGADFDGDFVLVIPNNPGKGLRIKSEPMLKELKDFDPHRLYKQSDEVPRMKPKTKGLEMGKVSNLITDMTILGATNEELSRAVRHSMVVIDAEKHHLNYRKSAKDFGIDALSKRYQPKPDGKGGGAATLISRAGSTQRIPDRALRRQSEGGPIDPKTGRQVFTDKTWVDRNGNLRGRMIEVDKLALTNDARTLVSKERTAVEMVYADHSNTLKGLANEARKEVYKFKPPLVDLNAKRAYKTEVDSLVSALRLAQANKPLERQAQILTEIMVKKRIEAKPEMDKAEIRKITGQELAEARIRTGADKTLIRPSPREWAAIQAGAISHNQLKQILDSGDIEHIRELATPRAKKVISVSSASRARSMAAQGFNQADIAKALGVSPSTIRELLS